jgi:tetratricopeptide (TPR) repeat protein
VDENAVTQPELRGGPSDASGPAGAEGPPEAALQHYDNGRRHYLAGRYRDALAELKAALEYDRNAPDLIYNIARVYENLAELDEAIAYYQRYLALIPLSELEERDRTEKTIRRLQGAKDELAGRQGEDAPSSQPRPQLRQATPAGRADLAFWLTGGAALAFLAGGATCGALALHNYNRVGDFVVGKDGDLEARQDKSDNAKRFALVADGLFIAGGVALATAAALFLLRDAEQPEQQPRAQAWRLGVDVGDRRTQLSLTGHF